MVKEYKRIPKNMCGVTTSEAIDEIEKANRTSWSASDIDRYSLPFMRLLVTNAKKGDKQALKYAEWNGFMLMRGHSNG